MTITELAAKWANEVCDDSSILEDFYNIAIGRGDALIVLDGVDILSRDSIKQLISQIEILLETTTCPIIVLTRPLADEWNLFRRVRLPDRRSIKRISYEDRIRFASTWFSAFPAGRRGIKRMVRDFNTLLKNPVIRNFTSTPSGLNKVCLLMSYK